MKALTIWLTGLSGAGKSTLAQQAAMHPALANRPTAILDGDVLPTGLCKDLGFSPEDRHENIRRVAEVSRLMNDAGVTVFCALISPLRLDRAMARDIVGPDRFLEIYMATSLETCESRDPKGLYRRARAGLIQQFTGIDAPYEVPYDPVLTLDTLGQTIDEAKHSLVTLILARDQR